MAKFTPRRCQILKSSGAGYFKAGQFAYVIGQNSSGGLYWQDREGASPKGERVYLVSKTKDMRGGALWFSRTGVRFTARRRRRRA